MKKSVGSFLGDLKLNLSPSVVAFYMMRVTGIALAVFLIMHIFSIGQISGGKEAYSNTMKMYDSFLFHLFEYILFLFILFHAANGIRVMMGDFCKKTRSQKKLLWITMGVAAVTAIVSLPVFF